MLNELKIGSSGGRLRTGVLQKQGISWPSRRKPQIKQAVNILSTLHLQMSLSLVVLHWLSYSFYNERCATVSTSRFTSWHLRSRLVIWKSKTQTLMFFRLIFLDAMLSCILFALTFHKHRNLAKPIKRALHLTELRVWFSVANIAAMRRCTVPSTSVLLSRSATHEHSYHWMCKGNDKSVPVCHEGI
jgi:hypothetical protein